MLISQLVLFQRIELAISDLHFRLSGQRKIHDISVILVDQYTEESLGNSFSREHYAVVANSLANEAKTVAFDCLFDQERPDNELGDEMLVEVTSKNSNIIHVWDASLSDKPAISDLPESVSSFPILEMQIRSGLYHITNPIHLPYPDLLEVSKIQGLVSVFPDIDGSVRRIPLVVNHNDKIYPSLTLAIVCQALNVSPAEVLPGKYILLKGFREKIKIPIDHKGRMIVNYAGDITSFGISKFSFRDVYESIRSGEPIVPLSTFKDKIAIIGISNSESLDKHSTPFDNLLPGVAIHAMAIDTIMQNLFLDKASFLSSLLFLLFFVVAALIVASYIRSWMTVACIIALISISWLATYLSFRFAGTMFSSLQSPMGIILSTGGVILYDNIKARITFIRPSPHNVFISYSGPDKKIANKIRVALEAKGIGCWMAPIDISPGEDWPAAITGAIRTSRVFILIFSSHSNRSMEVEKEVRQAMQEKVRVIPFRIENIALSEFMQSVLWETQWVDALKRPRGKYIQQFAEDVRSVLSNDS